MPDTGPAEEWSGLIGARRVFDLEKPRTPQMPVHPSHRPGFSYLLHRYHEDEDDPEEGYPRTTTSGLIICMEHTGTHIDILCRQSDDLKLYGDISVNRDVQTSRGFTRHGVEEIPSILASGVLLDIAVSKGVEVLEPGYAVSDEDLEICREERGVTIEPGSVALVVRLGNARFWDEPERYPGPPGMAASASYWLAQRQVPTVGVDNMAWDVLGARAPELGCFLPRHLILLARRGIYVVENLQLDALAAKAHRFLFVCTSLKFVGATGSPFWPLALLSEGL